MKTTETKTNVITEKNGTKTYVYPKIKCPYCGAEFVPSEIFLRDHYLGKITYVERDEKNRIVTDEKGNPSHYVGIPQDMREEFKCDFCDKKFTVEAEVSYTVKGVEFEEEYVTTIYKDRINLGA